MFKELGEQLRRPSGAYGKIVAKIMDKRNREFYENKKVNFLFINVGRIAAVAVQHPGFGANT